MTNHPGFRNEKIFPIPICKILRAGLDTTNFEQNILMGIYSVYFEEIVTLKYM